MLKLVGHHTCSNKGNGSYLEKQGFPTAKANYEPDQEKNPFLGSGYYFWDYNIGMAHYWGKTHYTNSYYIFEADIPYDENMLDLVGNRQHMEWLLNLMQDFQDENEESEKWELGKFIEFLKEVAIEQNNPNFFPFTSIRAIDHYVTKFAKDHYFASNSKNFINLNPRIIICIITANAQTIQNFKLIYPTKK